MRALRLPNLLSRAVKPPATTDVGGGNPKLQASTLVDFVAPDGLVELADHLQLGPSQYVRAFSIAQFPSTVWIGWMDDLYNAADVDVAVHLVPQEAGSIVRQLTSRMEGLQAQLMLDYKRGNMLNRHVLERDIDETDALRARVQWGEDRVFSAAVVFTLTSSSLEDLDRRGLLLLKDLEARLTEARCLFLRQVEGAVTVSPIGSFKLDNGTYRLVNLGAATGFYPFGSADMAHAGGVLVGPNLITGGPVLFNAFAGKAAGLTNPHVAVVGKSGAGKTTFLMVFAARNVVAGRPVVILDPEGQFSPMVANLGGLVITLRPGQPSGINPLDVEEDEVDADSLGLVNLQEKIVQIRALVSHMVRIQGGRVEPEEMVLLDRLVSELYAERGIDTGGESLYEEYAYVDGEAYRSGRRRKRMPTLTDLHAKVVSYPELKRLGLLLEPYLASGPLGLFDCESTVGLSDAMAISFNMYHLEANYVRPLAMHVVNEWISEKFVKKRPGQKFVLEDEFWMMMKHEDTALATENAARRWRKRLCSLVLASQSFTEFKSDAGKAILSNCDSRILMMQKPDQLVDCVEVFDLTVGESTFLSKAGQGQMLFKTGAHSVVGEVDLTAAEKLLLGIPVGD